MFHLLQSHRDVVSRLFEVKEACEIEKVTAGMQITVVDENAETVGCAQTLVQLLCSTLAKL